MTFAYLLLSNPIKQWLTYSWCLTGLCNNCSFKKSFIFTLVKLLVTTRINNFSFFIATDLDNYSYIHYTKVCKMNGGSWDRPDGLSPSLIHMQRIIPGPWWPPWLTYWTFLSARAFFYCAKKLQNRYCFWILRKILRKMIPNNNYQQAVTVLYSHNEVIILLWLTVVIACRLFTNR